MRVPLDTAASICGVKPGTIRRWVADRRITTEKGPDGKLWYDVDELLQWLSARNPDALYSRAGLKPNDRPGDTRHRDIA